MADSDIDGDGVLDCVDGCPDDKRKWAPGECDCPAADLDHTQTVYTGTPEQLADGLALYNKFFQVKPRRGAPKGEEVRRLGAEKLVNRS